MFTGIFSSEQIEKDGQGHPKNAWRRFGAIALPSHSSEQKKIAEILRQLID
jgi:hypothetical protein